VRYLNNWCQLAGLSTDDIHAGACAEPEFGLGLPFFPLLNGANKTGGERVTRGYHRLTVFSLKLQAMAAGHVIFL
jgi:hypothetical protein